ncbi:DUF262 domain-containing protein [Nesterenkonia sp. Act20]|uniref:DUF262 domain-containing protein n=1 Tax=Nesterenkonia sp. Act20 TaxID=1483432 RepID=UPI001C46B4DB|nr:DUF262 domain-containing protein [Nesterenkonia sp. Act20]
MGHLPAKTIAATLRGIQTNDFVLPAIQREYVWKPSQVVRLFDSILRGYPIGSFLAWRIDPETSEKFKFYGFMKDYSQFDNRHNPDLDLPQKQITAVLDGQQRLTSLNIGLRGSYAVREKYARHNSARGYPARRLYLNVLGEAPSNEAGLRYDFRLLTDEQIRDSDGDTSHTWYPVTKIFNATNPMDTMQDLAQLGLGNNGFAIQVLGDLFNAVHAKESLQMYEETDQDVERVLDIFIRVNSGGTTLSYSDLLLSIATAQWKERDARDAIHGLVDSLNNTGAGFSFSQDVVLKAGLMLAGINDIAFKVKNFTTENMTVLDQEWDEIGDSLKLAAGLLSDFGLSDATLSAKSVIIPVAYYLHSRGLGDGYRVAVAQKSDRAMMRAWVLRSLIARGIWGSGLDTLLRDLRAVLHEHGQNGFPVTELERAMAARGKSLAVSDELVEDILDLSYGGARTFAVLAMLFDHVDTRNQFHVDHVFPKALLNSKRLRSQGFSAEDIEAMGERRDLLANLQLLPGPENIEKSATAPSEWAAHAYPTPDAMDSYLSLNELTTLPHDAHAFVDFFEARQAALAERIRRKLSSSVATSATVEGDEQLGGSELDAAMEG